MRAAPRSAVGVFPGAPMGRVCVLACLPFLPAAAAALAGTGSRGGEILADQLERLQPGVAAELAGRDHADAENRSDGLAHRLAAGGLCA